VEPETRARLEELVKTANRYRTKACGMHNMFSSKLADEKKEEDI